jgi:hypothetical protein
LGEIARDFPPTLFDAPQQVTRRVMAADCVTAAKQRSELQRMAATVAPEKAGL